MLATRKLLMPGRQGTNRMRNDSAYDPLVPTVLHEPWWLQAASDGACQEVKVTSDGRVIGRLPYMLYRLRGRPHILCAPPPLTWFLGPAIDVGSGSACNQGIKRVRIVRELLEKLPAASGYSHLMHGDVTEMLAFQERNYHVTVNFTYEVAPASKDVLWRQMRDKTRNVIRRAEEQLTVAELTDAGEFAALYAAHRADAGKPNNYPAATMRRIVAASQHHGQGRVLAARDAAGTIVAAIFYVWDQRSAYYMLTTRAKDAGNGAVSLLLWSAMCHASGLGLIFDFAGVGSNSGRALFSAGFGGTVAPRYVASRYTSTHLAMDWVRMRFRR